ncbi:MAG: Dabb family protein [Ferruginibacter sp.]|nr:Dabb family protein [Chitinophagaceae bacterium]
MKKISRRQFVGDTSRAVIAGTVILAADQPKQREMKNIFVHHVFFWLKNAGNAEDLGKLVAGLKKLSAVSTIKQFHIGKPAATSREVIDGSYAVSWLVLFDNKADQDSYQADPIHLLFVEDCASLWKKVIVYDSVDL